MRGLLILCALTGALWVLLAERPVRVAVAGAAALSVVTLLWVRHRLRLRARRQVSALGDLLAMAPGEFEEAVARLLTARGYRKVRRSGGPADLGADITCQDPGGELVIVQCKRHAPGISVASGEIQRLLGALAHHGAQRGMFVTTSRFSAPASALADAHGIELLDGQRLTDLALRGKSRSGPRRQPTGI